MTQSDPIDRLMRAALSSDEEFVLTLNNLLKHDLRISVRELSEKSGISQSSLYKLLHGKRSPNLSRCVPSSAHFATSSMSGMKHSSG